MKAGPDVLFRSASALAGGFVERGDDVLVDLASVAHPRHEHGVFVHDRVCDALVTHANAIGMLRACYLIRAWWMRFIGERGDPLDENSLQILREVFQLPFCATGELNSVGHESL